jgi:hypothetical protein
MEIVLTTLSIQLDYDALPSVGSNWPRMEFKLRRAQVCPEEAAKLPEPRLISLVFDHEIQITRVGVKRFVQPMPIRRIKLLDTKAKATPS